jgi:DNA replication protein
MSTTFITDQLRNLRLAGMLTAFQEQIQTPSIQQLPFEERFKLMVDRELSIRDDRKVKRRLTQAKLKGSACIPDIWFDVDRKLDRSQIMSFANCDWIRQKLNIILTGPTGVGKTYIANALAHQACLAGFTAQFFRIPLLFSQLSLARVDGSWMELVLKLAKVDVLLLDDWGLSGLTESERRDFLEIMEDRFQIKSTIIMSQIPVPNWHALIGDPTIADAIMDRLIHNAHVINIDGDTMRKLQFSKSFKKEG